ncbi:MAG: DNA polymerase III subunit beta [Oscillospiraceae bacterium]|nr:DNA polymerase III subunit beta [Oscillospiraceae bacterium]
MKFRCNRTALYEAIVNASKAVPQKSNIAALEGIKLAISENSLEVTGYDLELGIQTKIDTVSSDSGIIIVNARLFSEIIRRMSSDELNVEIDEMLNVTITGNNTEYNISAVPADEYPDLPKIENNSSITMTQSILKNMIGQTNYAVAVNDNKPILTGELFEIENGLLRMVAIDGYRLAIRNEQIKCYDNINFVVPSKTLNEVSKLLSDSEDKECTIFVGTKHIIFDISGYQVISRLLEGEFHNYKSSIPSDFKTEIIIKTREFCDSVERCSLLINDKNKSPIKCSFEGNSLRVECKTGIGKVCDMLESEINGEPITIGFNNKYLLDALKASETDKIKIQMIAPNRPIKVIPVTGDSFMFLLMPIQLKN